MDLRKSTGLSAYRTRMLEQTVTEGHICHQRQGSFVVSLFDVNNNRTELDPEDGTYVGSHGIEFHVPIPFGRIEFDYVPNFLVP